MDAATQTYAVIIDAEPMVLDTPTHCATINKDTSPADEFDVQWRASSICVKVWTMICAILCVGSCVYFQSGCLLLL